MKTLKILPLFFIILLFFTACDKNKPGGVGKSGHPVAINIANGETYDIDSVYAVKYTDTKTIILDRVAYDNGRFTIYLPSVLAPECLENIMKNSDLMEEYFTISDKTANLGGVGFRAYRDGMYCGTINCRSQYGGEIYSYADYAYVDKPLKVKGQVRFNWDMEEIRMDISFNKGWNTTRCDIYEEGDLSIVEFTSNNVQGLQWHVHGYY